MKWLLALLLVLAVLACLDLFKDPYFHKEKVNAFEWLRREFVEVRLGEKA